MDAGQVMKVSTRPRHLVSTRLWHWLNALALTILLMSGLMIFNAHPRLYWGEYGARHDAAWLEIDDTRTTGFLQIGSVRMETTGVLGLSLGDDDRVRRVAFPGWATIPTDYSLAAARRWHFAFAWIFSIGLTLFMAGSLLNGHVRRDLHIPRAEWRFALLWQELKDHARLRFGGPQRSDYNVLQKFSYVTVIFILLPLMIFSGIAMSPAMNAAWPWLLDIFAGRQSARSIHFICAFLLALFMIVHLVMLLLSGPISGLRSMITGHSSHGEGAAT
jgi:thiosulfate reductase cytochrome b subunit